MMTKAGIFKVVFSDGTSEYFYLAITNDTNPNFNEPTYKRMSSIPNTGRQTVTRVIDQSKVSIDFSKVQMIEDTGREVQGTNSGYIFFPE
ncbi:hypothetical protein Novomoskovsk_18 [Bacillus phage Novomoskovsk]|uniref:Uncharacterized protein n=1 Tax=Bacillus phage Novomoskovsk TaxID=2736258 RepID=A0A6M9Z681_9CAUD|nr:hypothetical protein Novomoskovsk_18 [Bacillus phage Novomoskovsk]